MTRSARRCRTSAPRGSAGSTTRRRATSPPAATATAASRGARGASGGTTAPGRSARARGSNGSGAAGASRTSGRTALGSRTPTPWRGSRALVLPPAWTDAWICPHPRGHIQAVGTDEAGRRQYRYHDQWRTQRDAEKHERVVALRQAAPDCSRDRSRPTSHERGMTRNRVLAARIPAARPRLLPGRRRKLRRAEQAPSAWPPCAAVMSPLTRRPGGLRLSRQERQAARPGRSSTTACTRWS